MQLASVLHLEFLPCAALTGDASSVASGITHANAPAPSPSQLTSAVEAALRAEVSRLTRELVEAKEDLLRDEGVRWCRAVCVLCFPAH